MAVTSVPVFATTPNNGKVTIVNADGQNQKTVYTGAAGGSKIIGLILSNTDTSLSHDVQVSITRGGTSYPLGTVSVPTNAGFNSGVSGVNGLNPANMIFPVDSDGNPEILLNDASDSLTVSALTTLTSPMFITAVAFAIDFVSSQPSNVPTYPQAVRKSVVQILNATGSGTVNIFTAGSNGSKIKKVICKNTDNAFHGLSFFLNDGTQWRLGVSRANAGGAGSGFPSFDLMKFLFNGALLLPGLPVDADGNFMVLLKAGEIFQINTGQTVGAGNSLTFTAFGVDF